MDLTFLIPTRIETEDRLRNIISSVSYLLRHTAAHVIVKEVAPRNTFLFRALPEIRKYADTTNLTHLYEETNEPLFCKSKVLNDLIVESSSRVVANYDADCILPISSYQEAYDLIINDKADIVYPYQCGIYQWCADFNMEISNSTIGWCQFIDRQKYIDSYMMNENFVSWGCEDDEFYFRMSTLGHRIARLDNYVYHLEHGRTHNSWFSNPNFNNNYQLWNTIKTFDRDQLVKYYESQDYLKTRKAQLK